MGPMALVMAGVWVGMGTGTDLVSIETGTPVGIEAPAGWTHLVVKSTPFVATGDVTSLPAWAAVTAGLFRTVIAAEVTRGPGGFVLARVGIGLCTPVAGRGDLVIRSGELRALEVSFGPVERQVLAAGEAELDRGRLAAVTDGFALYRGPVRMPTGRGHREVDLCYGLLVDPRTGELRAVVWSIDPAGDVPPDRLVALATPAVFDCPLDVRAWRVAGLVPVSWSFAMAELPPGREVAVPAEVGRLMRGAAAGRGGAADLERALRDLLAGPTVRGRAPGPPAPAGGAAGSGPGPRR